MASGEDPESLIRFGAFEIDLESGELRKHGLKIKLRDQSFQVLAPFAGTAGQGRDPGGTAPKYVNEARSPSARPGAPDIFLITIAGAVANDIALPIPWTTRNVISGPKFGGGGTKVRTENKNGETGQVF